MLFLYSLCSHLWEHFLTRTNLKKKKIKIQVVLLLACIDEGIMVLRKGGGAKAKRVNPSTPRSDQHVTSPCDVHMFSSKQLMRILKLIRKKF